MELSEKVMLNCPFAQPQYKALGVNKALGIVVLNCPL